MKHVGDACTVSQSKLVLFLTWAVTTLLGRLGAPHVCLKVTVLVRRSYATPARRKGAVLDGFCIKKRQVLLYWHEGLTRGS